MRLIPKGPNLERFGIFAVAPRLWAMAAILVALSLGPAAAQTVAVPYSHAREMAQPDFVGRARPELTLDLKVILGLRNKAALDKLLSDQQDPDSPQYQRWLTRDEFDSRFGPSQGDFQSVIEWLKSQGFTPTSSSLAERCIRFRAPVAQAERLFGVTIAATADGSSFGNVEDPSIPTRFGDIIGRIEGLDNLRRFVPLARPRTAMRSRAAELAPMAPFRLASFVEGSIAGTARLPSWTRPDATIQGIGNGFAPSDFYTFYDETPLLSSVNGAGKDCIALIEDSDFAGSSVDLFDSTFSLPSPDLTTILETSNPGTTPDEFETLLDIEWAHAVAPGAPINVYVGNNNNAIIDPITDGIKKAAKDNQCSTISISFSICGAPNSFFTGVVSPIFSQAAAQGQSVFIASGDFGAAGLTMNPKSGQCVAASSRNVNELAADPHVTAVGGTQFNANFDSSGNDVGFVPENAWNDGSGATGGGASAVYLKPSYQKGVTSPDGRRDVPDVSIIASVDTPGVFVADDQNGPILDFGGGTSLSSPVWAGIASLLAQSEGKRLGNINTRLYQLGPFENSSKVGLRDVTKGSNNFNRVIGFKAGPLYDLATGWGTADIANLAAAFPTASLSIVPATVAFPKTGIGTQAMNFFKIANLGLGTLHATLDLNALKAPFTVPTASAGPFDLGSGQNATVTVVFAPTKVGNPTGTIKIASNDPKHRTAKVSVSGKAVPPTLKAPAVLNFGRVAVNGMQILTLTVTNTGLGVLTGRIDATGLSLPFSANPAALQFMLSNGQTSSIDVQFAPKRSSRFRGKIKLNSNDPAHKRVSVDATGSSI